MSPQDDRRWPWVAGGYALFLAVVAAATAFLYDSTATANRPGLIRVAVGFTVGVILIHLLRHSRASRRWDPPSALEQALRPSPIAAEPVPEFLRLRDEVEKSVASQTVFERMLWPRLCALSRARGGSGEIPLPQARGRLGRGPSLQTIAALIARIDGQETRR